MPEIQLPNSRRYSDVHFRLSIDDNGVPLSWDSVTIKRLFMYSEKQRGFGGKCSFQVGEDPHYLDCTFHSYNQQFLGIHRVVIQVELEGNVNTYDARVTNMVASTSNEPVIYDSVIDVPIHVSMVDTTVLYEILAACRMATSEATDAADRADGAVERMSGGNKNEVLTKLSNEPLDFGWKPPQGGGNTHPYLSLARLRPYLYKVTFDTLPEDNGGDGPVIGGCSSYVKDGKLRRNLDFKFDNAASFIVRTRDFEGMSFVTGLNDGEMDDELIAQLPHRVVDGRNNDGIMVSTHVLFNDWDWTGAGERNISLTRLPFLVLTKVKSMATIASDLADVLGNLNASEALQTTGYLLQVLVTDGTTTYAILPPTSAGQSFVLQDITANPKLANFRWVNRSTVARADADLQTRPTGIERFNAMPCALSDLRFTKAYEDSDRLSEFIGIDETTKESSDAELLAIYQLARAEYLDRQRDGKTWQTMHSVVYGDKMEHLYIQEDWSDDICATGVSKEYVDGEIERVEGEIPTKTSDLTNDSDFQTGSQVDAAVNVEKARAEAAEATINSKIPSQASSSNKLADKAFVNSSVQTAAANFRGNWATKSAIPTDYTLYPADYTGNKKPTTNDYLVIQADESQDGGTWRYKYTGDWDTDGISGWNAEYEVNETPLTAAQLAALNSGITAQKVAAIIPEAPVDGKTYGRKNAGWEKVNAEVAIPITYSELKALREDGELIPGMQYRITDYHCTTAQAKTTSADHQFDVIATADSESALNENARAIQHDGDAYFADSNLSAWELKYSLDNDADRFAWADATNGKGVIYYMKDEFNNECPYDFKNIQFYRKWNSTKSLWCDDGTASNGVAAYTFSSEGYSSTTSFTDYSLSSSNNVYSNVIKEYININSKKQKLNNNCFFGDNCGNNTFGSNCYDSTFGDYCSNNTFGSNCYSNTFGSNCEDNAFGDECYYNTFGTHCSNNTFGDYCYSNTFRTYCTDNTFGTACTNNSFGSSCQSNTFGTSCYNNTFASDSTGTAGNYFQYNKLENGVQYCILYNTSTASSYQLVKNYHIKSSVAHLGGVAIEATRGLSYNSIVEVTSDGELRTYCGADVTDKVTSLEQQVGNKEDKNIIDSDTETTAVSEAMVVGKTYKYMPSAGVATLAFTLTPPTESDVVKFWRFKFKSGATATEFTPPSGLYWPDGEQLLPEADTIYEIMIDEDYCVSVLAFKQATA